MKDAGGSKKLLEQLNKIDDGAKQLDEAGKALDGTSDAVGDTKVFEGTTKYEYDPRIRQRAVQDPGGHNFPFSYDDVILNTKPTTVRGGAQGYALRGFKNGKEVIYNIIVKDGKIVHRDMISIKNWAQRSKSFGWPIKLEEIPR